jgi:hypothetical protein
VREAGPPGNDHPWLLAGQVRGHQRPVPQVLRGYTHGLPTKRPAGGPSGRGHVLGGRQGLLQALRHETAHRGRVGVRRARTPGLALALGGRLGRCNPLHHCEPRAGGLHLSRRHVPGRRKLVRSAGHGGERRGVVRGLVRRRVLRGLTGRRPRRPGSRDRARHPRGIASPDRLELPGGVPGQSRLRDLRPRVPRRHRSEVA